MELEGVGTAEGQDMAELREEIDGETARWTDPWREFGKEMAHKSTRTGLGTHASRGCSPVSMGRVLLKVAGQVND